MPLNARNIAVIEDKSTDICNLTEADITDKDVPLLCEYLAKNPHKKKIILDRTEIRDATAEFAKFSLTKLSLRQTNVHDESIKVLCHSDIEYLDFGRTSLTNQAADYLIKHAKQTKIWVDVTNITPDKIQEINRRTESNKQKSGEELLRATLFGSTAPKTAERSPPSVSDTTNFSSSSPASKNESPHH